MQFKLWLNLPLGIWSQRMAIKSKIKMTTYLSFLLKSVIFIKNINTILVDFDWKTFEADCRKIVNDISEKFLDLGLDEGNHSDFGQDLIEKQAKYRKEF